MDTTKQSAMNATKEQKQDQMERELSRPIISDSPNESEDKGTSSKAISVEMIDNTPFMVIETKEKAYLAIGKYRMEREFPSKEAALKFLGLKGNEKNKTNWEAITFVLSVIKSEIDEYLNQRERSLK